MPADCVSASGALVLELGPDVVAVAAINDGQLTECRPGFLAPSLPDGTVAVPVPRHDPGGRVAELVDQGVPYTVRTVEHFGRQLDSAQAHIFRKSSTCVRKSLIHLKYNLFHFCKVISQNNLHGAKMIVGVQGAPQQSFLQILL